MPYMIVKNGEEGQEFCVYHKNADGKPMGDSLGCHPTPEDAQQQIAAIWANEGAANKVQKAVTEHSCRLRDDGDFQPDSFRRIQRGEHAGPGPRDGKQLSIIVGKLKGEDTMTTQAYRYPVDTWTEEQARGHCSEEGGKFDAAPEAEESKAAKVGARHSRTDRELLKDVHRKAEEIKQHAVDLGAELEEAQEQAAEAQAEAEKSAKDMTETVITFGGAVKALGDGRVGGHLILFSGEDDPDLEREYFDAQTNYGPHRRSLVFYQHGADKKLGKKVLDDDAELGIDDLGVWIRAQLDLRDAYERFIYEQVEAGKMGWSSGTAPHLVEKDHREGKATHIRTWPLGLDASITPTPAEPRNTVMPLKSLVLAELEMPAEEPAEAGEKPAPVKAAEPATPIASIKSISTVQERITMSDEIKAVEAPALPPNIMELVQAAVQAGITKALADMPAFQKAFVQAPEGKDRPETKSFSDYLVAIQRGDVKRLEQLYNSSKAMSETTGESGGYLVPPEYSNEILKLVAEKSIIRPRANIIPATTREFNYPVLKYTGTTANQPHALGGVVATWTEEAGAKTATEVALGTIKLVYHELSGYTLASNNLRADAGPTLENLLRSLFAEAIAWYEDWAFLRGDGAAKPLGILNSPALVKVATGDSLTLAYLAAMMEAFMGQPNTSGPGAGGVWIMHRTALSDLIALSDLYNIVWIQNAQEKVPVSLFGCPIIFTEKMPKAAGSGSDPTYCLLADLSYYLIYSRQQIQIDFSEHYKFINNQGTWRFVSLVDGQPWLQSAFTEADGSTEVSPFVCSKYV